MLRSWKTANDLGVTFQCQIVYKVDKKAIYDFLYVFIQILIIRCPVSEILAQIDHKGPNWTFLIPHLSYFSTWLASQQSS